MNRLFNGIIIVVLVLLVFSVSAMAETNIKDISKDHWAYESVKQLIDKGYLSLYEDGTFKGNNKVSRYELAVLISRILEDIQQGQTQVTEEDAATLRELSLEFREELVNLAQEQENLFAEVKNVKEKNTIQTKSLGKLREDVTELEEEKINNIEKEISNIIDNIIELKNLREEVESLNEELAKYTERVSTLETSVENKNEYLNELDKKISNVSQKMGDQEAIQDLADQQAVTQTTVHSLKNRVNTLEDKVENQNQEIESLRKQNDNYKLYIGAVALLSLIMAN